MVNAPGGIILLTIVQPLQNIKIVVLAVKALFQAYPVPLNQLLSVGIRFNRKKPNPGAKR
jgi:Zn-dependent protease